MIPVNDNYLEYVSDLANQNEMRPYSQSFVDQSIVNDASTQVNSMIGVDLKDEVKLRVNLES